MWIARYAAEFSAPPWRGLFGVSAAGFAWALTLGRHSVLPALCGGDWLLNVTPAGLGDALRLIAMTDPMPTLVAEWSAMLTAMMPPLLAQPVMYILRSSRPSKRTTGIAAFVLGYATIWMLVGPALILAAALANLALGAAAPFVVLVLAIVWSVSPWYQSLLNRGHRVARLRAFGWRATIDAALYGLRHGEWCLAACGLWMLVPLVWTEHHLAAMVVCGVVMLAQRMMPPRPPRWRLAPIAWFLKLAETPTREPRAGKAEFLHD